MQNIIRNQYEQMLKDFFFKNDMRYEISTEVNPETISYGYTVGSLIVTFVFKKNVNNINSKLPAYLNIVKSESCVLKIEKNEGFVKKSLYEKELLNDMQFLSCLRLMKGNW